MNIAFSSPHKSHLRRAFVDNTALIANALQIQFQRRLSSGLQALASYTWSHSIDDGSASSSGNASNLGFPGAANENRGSSDFDIRHAFSAGVTYNFPTPKHVGIASVFLRDWSTENFLLARSAPPVDIQDLNFFTFNAGLFANVRPDVVPGQALYLYGAQFPGGQRLNQAAFVDPPAHPSTGNAT
jgi:hypothetical protein